MSLPYLKTNSSVGVTESHLLSTCKKIGSFFGSYGGGRREGGGGREANIGGIGERGRGYIQGSERIKEAGHERLCSSKAIEMFASDSTSSRPSVLDPTFL